MIKTIMNGAGINVSNGIHSTLYIDMTRTSAGMVRYNGNNFEVYDGNSWMIIPSGDAQVTLDGVTLESLQWVRRKMTEEKRLEELAKSHPSVADAIDAVRLAEQQLQTVAALCKV
jgi:ligand-binding sensor domain-containing protein